MGRPKISIYDDWQIYQSVSNGYWRTKIMRGPWHVKTIATVTAWGGKRQAKKIIKSRND